MEILPKLSGIACVSTDSSMSFSYHSIHYCILYHTLYITAYSNFVGLIDCSVSSDLLSYDEAYGDLTETYSIFIKL